MAKTTVIKDRFGRTLHESATPTLKALVERYAREGVPMVGADLRGRNLSNLDLSGAVFDQALLDGADLRGTDVSRASFVGASMRGIQAQGLVANHAQFQGADLGPDPEVDARYGAHELTERGEIPTHLEGAQLTFTNFSGAILDDARLDSANMARSSLARAVAKRTSFRSVTLGDTDFSYGTFTSCDFNHSKLRSTTNLHESHLPDRTRESTAVGCSYKGAEMDKTVGAFFRDKIWTSTLKLMASTASAIALVVAVESLHLEAGHVLGPLLGTGPTLVVATTAALVLKDRLVEFVRDEMADKVAEVDASIRRFVAAGVRKARNLSHVGMAMVFGPGRAAVLDAIRTTRIAADVESHDAWEYLDFCFLDSNKRGKAATILFVNRKHLARALEIVSSGKTRHRINGDVVVIRKDGSFPDVPSVVRYRAEGGTSLAWTRAGKVVGSAAYNVDGDLVESVGAPADKDSAINTYMREFSSALLAQHGVALRHDPETHELRAGRDGGIIVVNRESKRPDNKLDAAIIPPSGAPRYFREGKEIDGVRRPPRKPRNQSNDGPDQGALAPAM